MLKIKNFTIISLLLILLTSCQKEKSCFTKAGKTIKEEQNIINFKTLVVKDIFNVYLTKDTVNKIAIECGENLVAGVVINQHNDTLEISDDNKCNFLRGGNNRINIYISFDTIKNITIEAPSNIRSTNIIAVKNLNVIVKAKLAEIDLNIDCNTFDFWNVGLNTGLLTLKGKVDRYAIGIFGTLILNAKDLIFDKGDIVSDSMADCHINGGKSLTATLTNSGNVYYYTKPDELIIKEISSSGKLIKR